MKLSMQKAVALFACTSFLLIGLCMAAALKKRWSWRKGAVYQEPYTEASITTTWAEPPRLGWGSMKKALMSSVWWSRGEQVGTELEWEWKRRAYTFACKRNRAGDFGWQSHYMIKEGCHLISVKKEALTSR